VLVAANAASTSGSGAMQREEFTYAARGVGRTLHYEALLPAGYATSGKRYPVVYFLHGLPASSVGYRDARFVEEALRQLPRQAIVVAPQASDEAETDPEYLDRGPGHNWETALTRELVTSVDARLRTIPRRDGRAIVGLSAGGYGAMMLALHNPGLYATVQSWSGYFHPTDPSGRVALDLGSRAANERASAHSQIRTAPGSWRGLSIGFYVGSGDARFLRENRTLHQELLAAGIPHVFRVYSGGHTHVLWRAHARQWLEMALSHLAAAA
jgi:enterochelin esterase-like enzyme